MWGPEQARLFSILHWLGKYLICFLFCDGWKRKGHLWVITVLKGDIIHAGSFLEEGFHQELCFGIRSGVGCFSILETGIGKEPSALFHLIALKTSWLSVVRMYVSIKRRGRAFSTERPWSRIRTYGQIRTAWLEPKG